MAWHTSRAGVNRGRTRIPEQTSRPVSQVAAGGYSTGAPQSPVEEEARVAAARQRRMITKPIDTEAWSSRYRDQAIDVPGRRVLITNFMGTEQERDLSEPPNCKGFGRIRHFQRRRSTTWRPNPLPIDPACRALRRSDAATIRAQVFQSAVCNWRSWNCFAG